MTSDAVAVSYDLREGSVWHRAHEHRRLWGRRFADYHVLDEDHIVIVFRPAGERWLSSERRRLERILDGWEAAA